MHFHSNLTPWHEDLMTHHVSPYYMNNNGQNINKCVFVYVWVCVCVWNAVILCFPTATWWKGVHLSSLHLCLLGIKCRQPIGSSSSLPLKPTCTFTSVDLWWWIYQEVGMDVCLQMENDLLAHEVEALQQEREEHQSEYALFHFKRIKTIWICNKQNSVVFSS